jgi:hypothetical protein
MTWVICGQCVDGYSGHDCGEDTCCCLEPEENMVCDTCNGAGGWETKEDFGDTITQDDLDQILMNRKAHAAASEGS